MSFVCSVCNSVHDGLPALGMRLPDYWRGLSEKERARGGCGSDLCRTSDGHFFVRAVLVLPMIDGPEASFEFGVWCSLSEVNFQRYSGSFDDNDQSKLGSMSSYLSNEIRHFPGSLSLRADLRPQDDRQRPLVELEPTDHPLAVAQHDGIRYQRVLEILHDQGAFA